ncbi:hypothetical protein IMCC3317_00930 [Kordia antarctica]|uniref:Uncharacterized protein n=1 Tax=Kordia antarctica TaxID=1218801 RepID=A0A7L4ZDV8_9FLAO|nr:hypothetical protein [Kordia antarctica]QHI34749.1 hypothetical protein IMCC3317_00930 [Kordia antarctica]
MKKKNFKTLAIRKENIVSLNDSVTGGALPTTQQTTVVKVTKKGYLCDMTPAVCPTNWFDC